jgi:hypothetical protein
MPSGKSVNVCEFCGKGFPNERGIAVHQGSCKERSAMQMDWRVWAEDGMCRHFHSWYDKIS